MIPRRIRLRNFLSYRECELDLSGLHIAVLTGKNGEGKSALLDAMTWAVWGAARGSIEEDRIRLHADEMLVDFEFEAHGDRFDASLGSEIVDRCVAPDTWYEVRRTIECDRIRIGERNDPDVGHTP